jgi:hypothetical protein
VLDQAELPIRNVDCLAKPGDLLLVMKISVAAMLQKNTTKMELRSIVMEMPTATQRAPKRKEPWGLGVSLTRALDLPSPFVSMRR